MGVLDVAFYLQKTIQEQIRNLQGANSRWLIVVVSLSGGKDSVYAFYTALKEGLNVTHLMFIETGGKGHLENKTND